MSRLDSEFVLRELREAGWFWAHNELLDVFAPQVGPYAVAVYLCLARGCTGNSPRVQMSLRRIESQWTINGQPTALSRSTIARSLQILLAAGMIAELHAATPSAPAEFGLVSLPKLAVAQTPTQRAKVVLLLRRTKLGKLPSGVSVGDTKPAAKRSSR